MWFRKFLLLFIVIAIAEAFVLSQVAAATGWGWTIFLIVLTGVIGVNLLKNQGFQVLGRFQEKLASGQTPAQEMIEGILLIIAGAFLITPGFLTDTLGFLWLLPQSRSWFASKLKIMGWFKFSAFNPQAQGRPTHGQNQFQTSSQDSSEETRKKSSRNGSVIDGEYERKD